MATFRAGDTLTVTTQVENGRNIGQHTGKAI
jgi:hypothetical protein